MARSRDKLALGLALDVRGEERRPRARGDADDARAVVLAPPVAQRRGRRMQHLECDAVPLPLRARHARDRPGREIETPVALRQGREQPFRLAGLRDRGQARMRRET
jgi:hypothetical protein